MKGMFYSDGEYSAFNGSIPLTTHALHYSSSVFEGIRVYNKIPFLFNEHIDRLFHSAKVIGLDVEQTVDDAKKICLTLIEDSGYTEAYIRPIFYNSGPELGVLAPENENKLGVVIWEWPPLFGEEAYNKGISLSTKVPYRRPHPSTFPTQSKASASYLIGTINRRIAVADDYDDALMLTHDGSVGEASGANIFMFINDELVTPTPDCFLNGLTKQTATKLATEKGWKCTERNIDISELDDADECFVTGTAYEILPVNKIDNKEYAVGERTLALAKSYQALTGTDYGF